MKKQFALGIDLGTSNSAASLSELDGKTSHILDVPQIVGPNQIGEKPTLPSALYLPHPEEFPEGSLRLPWQSAEPDAVVGSFAREHGAQIPDRLITSAKSWLSNPHVDPKSAILPWNADLPQGKLSPFEASRRYLEHLMP